jgi:hypothetical protein
MFKILMFFLMPPFSDPHLPSKEAKLPTMDNNHTKFANEI